MKKLLGIVSVQVCCAVSAFAAVTLFDFETEAERKSVPKSWDKKSFQVCVTNHFASSGETSLHFSAVPWRKGLPQWPSFTLTTQPTDWTKYDRLVVDLVSVGENPQGLSSFFTDPPGRIQNGLSRHIMLPAKGYLQWVIQLDKWPKTCNPKQISRLHFFASEPQCLDVFLDRITLLKKGEPLPTPSPALVKELVPFTRDQFEIASREVESLKAETEPFCVTGQIRKERDYFLSKFREEMDAFRKKLDGEIRELSLLISLQDAVAQLQRKRDSVISRFRFWADCVRAGQKTEGMLVGTATTMEQVMPRGAAYTLKPATDLAIRLARNETEGLQLAVTPTEGKLQNVTVSVSALKHTGFFTWAKIPASAVTCDIVGYVDTKKAPPYRVGYNVATNEAPFYAKKSRAAFVGWWPDPILNFLKGTDIAEQDVQSFWINIRCPEDQKAGTYRGKVEITADNAPAVTIPFTVRVNDFTLPRESPLPLAITFSPGVNRYNEFAAQVDAVKKNPDSPVNSWKRHKQEWGDFLADHYITMDSLYHHGGEYPHFDVLRRLREQGRLGIFNLGYWGYPKDLSEESVKKWREYTIPKLKKAYDGAKENGMLDHAYVYGCDEISAQYFTNIQYAVSVLKKELPGVPIATTAYDHEFGVGSPLANMDVFTPLTPKFDCEKAEKARAEGRKVWWYICCGPHTPHANMFVECPAIEGRILMGAMTTRMRPDGFLYYEITIWNSMNCITSGPFTEWDARSWTTYHGDGAWTCVGPDGTPLTTQRLENFRDGLEDFAYAKILEERLKACPRPDCEWAKAAKEQLAVPISVMQDMKTFTYDPAAVYQWRDAMADLIERAPVKKGE
ncbi:MAG: DUF4091 domain-containing protein [Kiritimatiellae bacterium]|nr:DUF4091 domain-containing protein [Kiritimatiellia bacterium]